MKFVLPVDVRVPIALFARTSRNWFVVTVSSLVVEDRRTDLSKLGWNIDGISPLKLDVGDGGSFISMVYPYRVVRELSLDIDTKTGYFCSQCDFIGSDLLEYMRSSSSDFGQFVAEEEETYMKEALVGIAVGLGFLMGLFFAGLDDRSDED
jgi:hypothetical protein